MKKTRAAVLLVPGFAGGNTFFLPFRDDLRSRGLAADCWRRSPVLYRRPLLWHGRRLAEDILTLADAGHAPLTGIGWSQGGHVWIAAMRHLSERFSNPEDLVRRVIAFGTPIEGSWAAHAGLVADPFIGTRAREMRPGSRTLDAQIAFLHQPRRWDFRAVNGTRDWLVRGAHRRLDPAWCHSGDWDHRSLLYDRQLFDLIHSLILMP